MVEPLVDGHGRLIRDLRVSVTDRCNFRCQYCMPAEGLPWLERSEILSFEEVERLVTLLASMGVRDVRLTGGEPLVRREFPALVARLARVSLVRDLSVTTNGYLLERAASATARVYRFRDGRGEIGFVNPVSEPFCADCNRIRLTAEGKLRTCLFSLHETDLRDPLRAGATEDELERIIRDAVWRKELKHHVGERGFRQPPRTMSAIGG